MANPPRILVTNDDGYTSEGIQVLADALEGLGEIWVVAPDSEQSAVSHALTLDRPLRIKRLGKRRVAVDGTPTDCVALAISNLMGGRPPDIVVSDPPRAGMHPRLVGEILDLAPGKIVYVSCNPATQVRDAGLLAEGGYRLTHIQPVDMFPHTPHIECVCVFEKQ